jgi:hypothetical protein
MVLVVVVARCCVGGGIFIAAGQGETSPYTGNSGRKQKIATTLEETR